jgi:hypothetical protein
MDRKNAADTGTGKICIGTKGRYTCLCADEAAKDVGTLMGAYVAADSNSTTLHNTKVVSVANASLAVGRLTKAKAANATTCEIEITGQTYGGPQASI